MLSFVSCHNFQNEATFNMFIHLEDLEDKLIPPADGAASPDMSASSRSAQILMILFAVNVIANLVFLLVFRARFLWKIAGMVRPNNVTFEHLKRAVTGKKH
jgi:hypothetical protein